jgi:hypothetical protein
MRAVSAGREGPPEMRAVRAVLEPSLETHVTARLARVLRPHPHEMYVRHVVHVDLHGESAFRDGA